jgi:predicted GNAT superfamily acetyltransferase
MKIRTLTGDDVPSMWTINEAGLPGVGKVSQAQMADLLELCVLPIGEFDGPSLVGFVLCLLPGTTYGSPNYGWFCERYSSFVYVDRIAVAPAYRNQQVGSRLYRKVFEYAEAAKSPIAAEVSLSPPNPGSLRFHARHQFTQIGTLEHAEQSVGMFLRNAQ